MTTRKILYLDDEENNLVAFKALFRRDYEIYTSTSPQEAVQLLNEHHIPVILSDQKMPEISGVEFFELTKQDFPNAVRVLVTGYADIEAVIDAINKGGVYRYVTKPWDENDLKICIENAFDKYESGIELERKNMALMLANSELEKFIYSASHDLRAPLVSIKGVINLARMEQLGEKSDQYFTMIEKSANKLDDFVQNIIHFYQNSKSEIENNPIDFQVFIPQLLEQYKGYEGAERIEFRTTINCTSGFRGDEYRFRIILGNLVANAIKFADSSKVSSIVDLEVIQNAEKVLIKITDNGLGIPADTTDVITALFNSRSEKSPGTGVGLYLIREAVLKMGGKIQVSSLFKDHTKFILEIPNKA